MIASRRAILLCCLITVSGCGDDSPHRPRQKARRFWPDGTVVLAPAQEFKTTTLTPTGLVAADISGRVWDVSKSDGRTTLIMDFGGPDDIWRVRAMGEWVLVDRAASLLLFDRHTRKTVTVPTGGPSAFDAGHLYVAKGRTGEPASIEVREAPDFNVTKTIKSDPSSLGEIRVLAAVEGMVFWRIGGNIYRGSEAGSAELLVSNLDALELWRGSDRNLYTFQRISSSSSESMGDEAKVRAEARGDLPGLPANGHGRDEYTLTRIDAKTGSRSRVSPKGESVGDPWWVATDDDVVCFVRDQRSIVTVSLSDGADLTVAYNTPGARCAGADADFVYAFTPALGGIARIPRKNERLE